MWSTSVTRRTKMPSVSTGGSSGTSYDYIQDTDPTADNDVEVGETWFDTTNNEPKIYDGSTWNSLSVTDHSQLSGITEGDHRTAEQVRQRIEDGDLARVEGANGHRIDFASNADYAEVTDHSGTRSDMVFGDVFVDGLSNGTWLADLVSADIGALPASDYNPEADTHSRYTDGEASNAAPVQDVEGQTGSVSLTTEVRTRVNEKSGLSQRSEGQTGQATIAWPEQVIPSTLNITTYWGTDYATDTCTVTLQEIERELADGTWETLETMSLTRTGSGDEYSSQTFTYTPQPKSTVGARLTYFVDADGTSGAGMKIECDDLQEKAVQ